MKTYIVVDDAWIDGKFYTKDSTVRMTEKQAKYYVLEGTLKAA